MKYKAPSELCSNLCGRTRRPMQRLCSVCHAEDMRRRRREHKELLAQAARALEAAGIRPLHGAEQKRRRPLHAAD